jgi:hypothetical protein
MYYMEPFAPISQMFVDPRNTTEELMVSLLSEQLVWLVV